jgi:soluble lytic murein transglycosylase-like protein
MTTTISNSKALIKVIIITMLITFLLTFPVMAKLMSNDAVASQMPQTQSTLLQNASTALKSTTELMMPLTTQDRMVKYMQSVNATMPSDLAYKLADAILVQKTKYNLSIDLQLGLIAVESRFDQYAISGAGALGFYQVMPSQHANKVIDMMKHTQINTKDVYDPLTNASIGGAVLHNCLHKKKNNMSHALSCYNGVSDKNTKYSKLVLSHAKIAKGMI